MFYEQQKFIYLEIMKLKYIFKFMFSMSKQVILSISLLARKTGMLSIKCSIAVVY